MPCHDSTLCPENCSVDQTGRPAPGHHNRRCHAVRSTEPTELTPLIRGSRCNDTSAFDLVHRSHSSKHTVFFKLRETPSNTTPELSAYQCNVKVPARIKQSETPVRCQWMSGPLRKLHHATPMLSGNCFFAFQASDMPSTHELPSPSLPPELRWDNDGTNAKPSRSCRWQAPVPPRALRSLRNGWQKVTHRNLPEDVMTKCSFMMVCGDLWYCAMGSTWNSTMEYDKTKLNGHERSKASIILSGKHVRVDWRARVMREKKQEQLQTFQKQHRGTIFCCIPRPQVTTPRQHFIGLSFHAATWQKRWRDAAAARGW